MRRHFGVADGRFKLIRFYEPDVDAWELYDIASDPKELKNVYGDPRVAADQVRLAENLTRLRKEYLVPDEDPPASFRGGETAYQKGVDRMKEKVEQMGLLEGRESSELVD